MVTKHEHLFLHCPHNDSRFPRPLRLGIHAVLHEMPRISQRWGRKEGSEDIVDCDAALSEIQTGSRDPCVLVVSFRGGQFNCKNV
jgi:hypothetical protein